MRALLIDQLPTIGFPVAETTISIADVESAHEVFLSNAMTPIKWVAALGNKNYDRLQTLAIYHKMRKTFPAIFC